MKIKIYTDTAENCGPCSKKAKAAVPLLAEFGIETEAVITRDGNNKEWIAGYLQMIARFIQTPPGQKPPVVESSTSKPFVIYENGVIKFLNPLVDHYVQHKLLEAEIKTAQAPAVAPANGRTLADAPPPPKHDEEKDFPNEKDKCVTE